MVKARSEAATDAGVCKRIFIAFLPLCRSSRPRRGLSVGCEDAQTGAGRLMVDDPHRCREGAGNPPLAWNPRQHIIQMNERRTKRQASRSVERASSCAEGST